MRSKINFKTRQDKPRQDKTRYNKRICYYIMNSKKRIYCLYTAYLMFIHKTRVRREKKNKTEKTNFRYAFFNNNVYILT